MRELRDIREHNHQADLAYLQKKISLAGEMKTAIKRFLDEFDPGQLVPNVSSFGEDQLIVNNPKGYRRRTKELRKAMEAYLNC